MAAIGTSSAGVGSSYMATVWAALGHKTTEGCVGAMRQFHWWSKTMPKDECWTARSSLEEYVVQLVGAETFEGAVKRFFI